MTTTNFIRIFLFSLFTLTCHFSTFTQAQDANTVYDWQLKKDKTGIQIFTSKVENSKYKAIRAVTEINTDMHNAIALILDLTACSEWVHLCVESKLIESVSKTENYIYTYTNAPFPIKNRDMVSHVMWQFDHNTGKVSMLSKATEGRVPQSKRAIRITNATAQWHFTTIDQTTLRVECYVHIDPAGPVPAWLSNLLLIKSPFKTIQNMRQILESGRYQSATPPFTLPFNNS